MTVQADISQRAKEVIEALQTAGLTLACAESCTGGLISASLTNISGASAVLDRGFVTYSNQAKQDMLGLSPTLLEQHGAVSKDVACAMAKGAINHSHASISIAVTGIAGPSGGTKDKPVGTIHLAASRRNGSTLHQQRVFKGDRTMIRNLTVLDGLELVLKLLT